jgi:hypothetical protein
VTPTEHTEEEFLNTGQAGRLLGVTRHAVKNWCAAGKFPGAFRTPGGDRRGGEWRIPRVAVESLKAGNAPANHDQEGSHANQDH